MRIFLKRKPFIGLNLCARLKIHRKMRGTGTVPLRQRDSDR
jgi:hypothetical protein